MPHGHYVASKRLPSYIAVQRYVRRQFIISLRSIDRRDRSYDRKRSLARSLSTPAPRVTDITARRTANLVERARRGRTRRRLSMLILFKERVAR